MEGFEDCSRGEPILRSPELGNSTPDGKQSYCGRKRKQFGDCSNGGEREIEIGSGSI